MRAILQNPLRLSHCCFCALLLATLAAGPLAAEPAALVTDLDSRADSTFSASPEPFAVFNGELYFWSTDPVTGVEPWKSDGTSAGTALLKDVCPGRCGSRPFLPDDAAVAAGALFFVAWDGAHGFQLWTSDGTARGTRLVEAFGAGDESSFAGRLTAWNDVLYFFAHGAVYRTDGTAAGTALIKDLGDRIVIRIVAAEDRLFISTTNELWTSDGTAAGTHRILELPIHSLSGSLGSLQTTAGGHLFFTTPGSSSGDALWRSDGTVAGTVEVYNATGPVSGLAVLGGEALLFDDTAIGGVELWSTVGGTAVDSTPLSGVLSSRPLALALFDGELYFAVDSTLRRSDGTAAGTRAVRQLGGFVFDLRVAGEALYAVTSDFGGGTEVWRTLGTAATTERVLGSAAGRVSATFPFGDELALTVERRFEGEELALLDPATGDGTLLTNAVDPGSADPTFLTDDGDRLLFVTGDGVNAAPGKAGATTDLIFTTPSAQLVKVAGGTFVFDDGLWFLDATDQAVPLLAPTEPVVVDAELSLTAGGELFFLVLDQSVETYELWRSDGTPAGTRVAAAGIPRNYFCLDPPCLPVSVEIEALEGEIFIVHQTKLLRADLDQGMVTTVFDADELDGCRGPNNFCEVQNLTVAAGRLFFTPYNIESFVLWTSDGTAVGTRPVRELLAAPVYYPAPIRELVGVGDLLYFLFPDPGLGVELWASDGTAAGTRVVRDVRPGPVSSFPRGLAAFDGRLVFAADDGVAGHELWVSDGTAASTVRVADVCPGRCSSLPQSFAAIDGLLVFAADDGIAGAEPWRSDLTAEGTWLIDDVSPGPSPSDPRGFTEAVDSVFFNAATAATGFELYAVPRTAFDDPAEALLVDGRFSVRVDWTDPRGVRGVGRPVVHDDHNVFFWFFGPDNVELLVKVLNGTAINDHYWVFYGALSAVEYTITVEDRQTGRVQTYHNPPGNICGQGDVGAFPAGGTDDFRTVPTKQRACAGDDRTLCLNDGRFRVEVEWTDPRGVPGTGRALPLTDATGAFWFFGPENLELVVKLLDGSAINGRYWFFYGGLSGVEYAITVTDTETGARRVYRNAAGEICGRGDVGAF